MESQDVINTNKISTSDYIMLETIGIGSYGRVKLCRNKKTGKVYACKMLKKSEIIRNKQVDHIFSEFHILSLIYHPFIVELRGICLSDSRYLYIIEEFIAGGELFSLLRDNKVFPLDQARFYAAHIVTIFEYLHSKNIIYRDLKPENILIQPNGYLKLTDFGFAKIIKGQTYTLCGTPEYLAPEIITNKGHGKPVDWWTLGILLFEMLTGNVPFTDSDPMNIYQKILKGKVNYPRDLDRSAKSIMKHLLVANLNKRYGCLNNGIKDIINHKFFDDFNWPALLFKDLKAPYVPKLKNGADSSRFHSYPDSNGRSALPLKPEKDPFLHWL